MDKHTLKDTLTCQKVIIVVTDRQTDIAASEVWEQLKANAEYIAMAYFL